MIKLFFKKYDMAIVGSLCTNDILFAEHLSRQGLRPLVLRQKRHQNISSVMTNKNDYFHAYNLSEIKYINNPFEFLWWAYQCRMIVSFTGSLIGFLNFLFFVKKIIGLPPCVHISTGSDLSELVAEKSIKGYLYRNYLNFMDMVYGSYYPHILSNTIDFKIKKYYFDRVPLFYILEKSKKMKKDHEVIFFHFSHLDWKLVDNKKGRNSSKGNDRFIKAFIRAVKSGMKARCVILFRGPDREAARKMIEESGCSRQFTWKPHLEREDLFQQMRDCDVVVDQFDVGGLGGGAIEAMSLGKPVMAYVCKECSRFFYRNDFPPVLNCQTEEEIYQQIIKCNDWDLLEKIGDCSSEWAIRNYRDDNSLVDFIFHYQRITGHQIIKYV
ncbi:MAG: glycosyltransferase [Oligoflexia bacterium]|nr:glycosyltransferase [Oligoflexia bacterium]